MIHATPLPVPPPRRPAPHPMAWHRHALGRSLVAGTGVLLYLLAAGLVWSWLLLWALWLRVRALVAS